MLQKKKISLIGQISQQQAESLGWTEIEPRKALTSGIPYLIGYPPDEHLKPHRFQCKCTLPSQV